MMAKINYYILYWICALSHTHTKNSHSEALARFDDLTDNYISSQAIVVMETKTVNLKLPNYGRFLYKHTHSNIPSILCFRGGD